jgi:long-subunit fatty acid transport protein|nr:hypothetical protein [Candidatus Krumholzibacteria bacterium]
MNQHLMNRALPIWIVLLLVMAPMAQMAMAQTPFAVTNLGQRIDPEDARMVGRGGWGMAVSDSLNPGFKNLAGLTALQQVAIKFTGYGDHVGSKDDQAERTTNRTISPDIRVGLPIIKGKLAFSTGMEVYRSNQFKTFAENIWYAWDDTLTGNEQFLREGTMWQVPLGLSWEVRPGIAVGAALGMVNGTIRESVVQEFITPNNGASSNPAPLYVANGRVQEDEFQGTAWTWSVLVSPHDRLKVGASWRAAHDLDVDRKITLAGVAERYSSTWTYRLPDEYRLGFDLRLASRWRLGADYQMMNFDTGHGRDDWQDALTDEYTFNAGLERSQGFVRRGGWSNLPLRLGMQHRQWGYEVGGQPVKETFYSVGTGFPFRQNLGQVDVALSYGKIGSLADNGVESDVWRFTMSITGLEKWW